MFLMSFACHLYTLIFYLCVLVCHSYISRMYSHAICMSLVCTRMSFVCHSYVLVCHPFVTGMYSYVMCISLVCSLTMNFFSVPYNVTLFFFYNTNVSEVATRKCFIKRYSEILTWFSENACGGL